MAGKKPNIRIVFKTGHVQEITADDFTVTHTGDKITKVSWDDASPRPLWLDLSQIESVWEL